MVIWQNKSNKEREKRNLSPWCIISAPKYLGKAAKTLAKAWETSIGCLSRKVQENCQLEKVQIKQLNTWMFSLWWGNTE